MVVFVRAPRQYGGMTLPVQPLATEPPPMPVKTRHDENFPVGSSLIAPDKRPPILAFYAFARTADDIADHPTMPAADRLYWLDAIAGVVQGQPAGNPALEAARNLARVMAARDLNPQHALHILQAFRQDVHKKRYRNWSELLLYCQFSAAPVGRFVLDVHGESPALWPLSDALCAALQVINHIQDCGQDYRLLDRIYLPGDWMQAAGVDEGTLRAGQSPPPLRQVLDRTLAGVDGLLRKSAALTGQVKDQRLARELTVIHAGAVRLLQRLQRQDPLAGSVRLSRWDKMRLGLRLWIG